MKRIYQMVLSATAIFAVCSFMKARGALADTPILTDPDKFEVELFADFATLNPPLNTFQMTISEEEDGFPAGMYVTSGSAGGTLSNRLAFIDPQGNINIIRELANNVETLTFAQGNYGEGILIVEPFDLRIRRLLPDGTLTTFAENVSSTPWGPVTLEYGADGFLYAPDGAIGSFSNGSPNILQINPEGTSEVFASIPEFLFPQCLDCLIQVHSALDYVSINPKGEWQEGGGFVSGTFSIPSDNQPSEIDSLFAISLDGRVTKLADGLSAVEFTELGPGGEFGSDLYIATLGSFPFDQTTLGNGAVYTLEPDGTITPFLTNINAADLEFDTQGIFGGGMFVSEGTSRSGPGRIWRIAPQQSTVPEPSSLLGLGTMFGIGVLQLKRTKRS